MDGRVKEIVMWLVSILFMMGVVLILFLAFFSSSFNNLLETGVSQEVEEVILSGAIAGTLLTVLVLIVAVILIDFVFAHKVRR